MLATDKTSRSRRLTYAAWGAAMISGLSVWFFLHHLETTEQESSDTVNTLIANRYIPKNATLRKSFFNTVAVPKAYAAPDALHDFDVLESSGRPLWRGALPIPEGTRLTQRELVSLTQSDALSQQIGENLVAVSFGVDGVRGIGGNLQPGDLIDVLHTPKSAESDPKPHPTTVLFQALRIIAVGRHWEHSSPSKDVPEIPADDDALVLTVVLNPLAAVRLAQARESETLSVILRAPTDLPHTEAL